MILALEVEEKPGASGKDSLPFKRTEKELASFSFRNLNLDVMVGTMAAML